MAQRSHSPFFSITSKRNFIRSKILHATFDVTPLFVSFLNFQPPGQMLAKAPTVRERIEISPGVWLAKKTHKPIFDLTFISAATLFPSRSVLSSTKLISTTYSQRVSVAATDRICVA
jgi:hypothetical protein